MGGKSETTARGESRADFAGLEAAGSRTGGSVLPPERELARERGRPSRAPPRDRSLRFLPSSRRVAMAEPAKDEQTAPAQRPVLPPSFSNSVRPLSRLGSSRPRAHALTHSHTQFWSVPYRQGLESLFTALEAACVQSSELVEHVQARADLEEDMARRMIPPALRRDGFATGAFILLCESSPERNLRRSRADTLWKRPRLHRPLSFGFPDDALGM